MVISGRLVERLPDATRRLRLAAPALVVLAWGVFQIGSPDKAPFGWGDSSTYVDIARNLEDVVRGGHLGYFALRLLPAATVHYAILALGLPCSDGTLQRAFEVLNLVLLTLSALAWAVLSERLALRSISLWLGFVLLFVNFGVVRWVFAMPGLTDAAGFAVGMGQAFGYLSGWRWKQVALAVLAFFVWPQAGVAGLLLFAFPRSPLVGGAAPKAATGAAAVASLGLVGWAAFLHLGRHSQLPFGGQQVHARLLSLSLLVAAGYTFVVIRGLLDARELWDLRGLAARLRPKSLVAVTMVGAAVWLIAHALGHDSRSRYPTLLVTSSSFLNWSVLTSIILPGVFLLAHVLFLGPGLLLMALFFRPFCRTTHRLGLGATLYVAGSLLFLLNSSSRVSFAEWPLLAAIVVITLEDLGVGKTHLLIVGLAAGLLARPLVPIWGLIGDASLREVRVPPFVAWMREWLPMSNLQRGAWRLLEFPHQHFFMTQGPWMSVEMYVVQGLAVVLLALVLRATMDLRPMGGSGEVADRPREEGPVPSAPPVGPGYPRNALRRRRHGLFGVVELVRLVHGLADDFKRFGAEACARTRTWTRSPGSSSLRR